MFKKIYIIFLFTFNFIFSQEKKIFIFSEDRLPIEDAEIYIEDSIKFVSNKSGLFKINKYDLYKKIKIKHLNYKSNEIDSLFMIDTIFLIQKNNILNEVELVIKKKNLKNKTLYPPNSILSELGYYKGWSTTFSSEYATYISNEEKIIAKIKSIKIELMKGHWQKREALYMPFKVNLYTIDTITKMPQKKIIDEGILIKKDKSNEIEVDISEYDLDFPQNGIFVSVDILSSDYYYNNGFRFNKGPSFKYLKILKNQNYFTVKKVNENNDWNLITTFIFKFGIKIIY